jgi:hypothetical protein
MTRSKSRSSAVQPDIANEEVIRIEFDNRWEGPGDVFQLVVERLADCPIRVVPADASPEFDAILLGGCPDYQAASDDRDNAALVQVQRVDDDEQPIGAPELVRVKTLRVSS